MKNGPPNAARLVVLCALLLFSRTGRAQQPARPPPSADLVEIRADSQQKAGDLYLLEGNVEIRYRGTTLTADEVTYNEASGAVEARGHVAFERDDDRLEAAEAHYNLHTGEGVFHQVEGTVGIPPKPTDSYLVTTNPFYFRGERVRRHGDGSYLVENGWVTNCQRGRPKWRLKTARAKIRPGHDARLYRSTFVLGGLPIFYLPFAALSLAEQPRQSGFLLPSIGNDSVRGTTVGTGFFWAINPHADLTLETQFFNQGGWTQSAEFRARPSVTSRVKVNYFGTINTRLSRRAGGQTDVRQNGQSAHIFAEGRLSGGFRGVLDITHLSSFRFRLGFAETFNEAVRSEVRADAFVSNNPGTFYFHGFFSRYQTFLQPIPETSVTLLTAPGLEFGTRPHWLDWLKKQPIYFSFDSSVSGLRRDEPRFQTPELVQRYSVYPRVTIPFRLGRYFGLTPTFGVRASRYSSRVVEDASQPGGKRVLNQPLRRITEEVSVDLLFPSLQRIFDLGEQRYKHVIEPEATYRYVNGVRSFEEIIRFDEEDILTDTHEIEYALTQRLFVKESSDGQAEELVSLRVSQTYYFDPDLRGALRPGERNVVRSLISLTPFAFADEPRRFSPIISVLRLNPQGRYSGDFRLDFDTTKGRVLNTRVSGRVRVTKLVRFSVAHFVTRNRELLQPSANQLRLLVGYGQLYRQGFNAAVGVTWDLDRDFLPNQVAQVSYNWDCCGVAFSFRRLGLGPLRSQNEYRFTFTVANVGTFGTLRERERLF
ncbi:MAG: LPS assembly protein LptD [Candidatus Acidoferrales bacterium]